MLLCICLNKQLFNLHMKGPQIYMGEKIPSRLTLTDIDAQAAIAARVASEQYYAQERAKLQAQERAKLQSAAVEQSAISNGIEHGIQKRIASDEVQKLNDRVKQLNDNAQFVLFGSKLDTKTGNIVALFIV